MGQLTLEGCPTHQLPVKTLSLSFDVLDYHADYKEYEKNQMHVDCQDGSGEFLDYTDVGCLLDEHPTDCLQTD